jgi:hypothetical protein
MVKARNDSIDFSDEAIRRFLFGRLGPAERSTFEEHLFTDDRLEARVRLAEFDLADDYAFARLGAVDREAFEQKFLLSAGRKRKLNVSTALRDRFASASTAATNASNGVRASIGERLRLLFGLDQRAWRFALGVVIVVALVGSVWLFVRGPRIKEDIKARIFNRRAPAPAPGTPRMAEHSNNTTSPPEHQTTSSPLPPHEPTASPVILSADLFPEASRDGDKLPRLNLANGAPDIVRLQLALKPNQTGTFRAELLAIDDQSIFSAQSLQSTGAAAGKVDFDIPAALLKTGDYHVKLRRADGGSKGSVGSYYFRVQ